MAYLYVNEMYISFNRYKCVNEFWLHGDGEKEKGLNKITLRATDDATPANTMLTIP